MLRAILIDDEPKNIENLSALLKKHCGQVTVVASASNATDGAAIIQKLQPDLLFLDIQMPGKNGFDLLRSLPRYDFEVIFVTAFDQYGIQAVKFAAIDYLLKPVNIDDLKLAVQKVVDKSLSKKQNLQLENFIQLLQQQQKSEHRIALPTAKETRFAYPGEIVRCESSNNYTFFFFESGEKLVVSKPIYEFDELLSEYGFIRCHQSHLVNKKFIKSLVKQDGGYLVLEGNIQIPVSRQKRDLLKAEMENIRKKDFR